VTSPARTLVDLAAVVAPRHLEQAFEEGLRSGVVSPEALREQVERSEGRRGVPLLRDLLGIDLSKIAKTKSRLEGRSLRFCSEEGIPLPEINAWVGGYEVDMSWPGTNVVVELDSWEFHHDRASFERDRAKWADLTAKGYRVIVITHRRLTREGPEVATTLRSLLG
jgi:hypothetical protein